MSHDARFRPETAITRRITRLLDCVRRARNDHPIHAPIPSSESLPVTLSQSASIVDQYGAEFQRAHTQNLTGDGVRVAIIDLQDFAVVGAAQVG